MLNTAYFALKILWYTMVGCTGQNFPSSTFHLDHAQLSCTLCELLSVLLSLLRQEHPAVTAKNSFTHFKFCRRKLSKLLHKHGLVQ